MREILPRPPVRVGISPLGAALWRAGAFRVAAAGVQGVLMALAGVFGGLWAMLGVFRGVVGGPGDPVPATCGEKVGEGGGKGGAMWVLVGFVVPAVSTKRPAPAVTGNGPCIKQSNDIIARAARQIKRDRPWQTPHRGQ